MSPFDEEYARTILPQLEAEIGALNKRVAVLEAALRDRGDVDARRDSFEIGTPSKNGNFKHYYDPGTAPDENDRLLAEQARTFVNGGGVLPDGFSPRIRALMNKTEALMAGGAPLPPAEVK